MLDRVCVNCRFKVYSFLCAARQTLNADDENKSLFTSFAHYATIINHIVSNVVRDIMAKPMTKPITCHEISIKYTLSATPTFSL